MQANAQFATELWSIDNADFIAFFIYYFSSAFTLLDNDEIRHGK